MIRNISINYLREFNKLGNIINKNFSNLYKLSEIQNNPYEEVLGYYIEDKLIGFIHTSKLYENMDIINIVVNPSFQHNGIGTSLINYVIKNNKDVKQIILEVNENNVNAINLYKKNKFSIISRRNKYYGTEDALIMKRDV